MVLAFVQLALGYLSPLKFRPLPLPGLDRESWWETPTLCIPALALVIHYVVDICSSFRQLRTPNPFQKEVYGRPVISATQAAEAERLQVQVLLERLNETLSHKYKRELVRCTHGRESAYLACQALGLIPTIPQI